MNGAILREQLLLVLESFRIRGSVIGFGILALATVLLVGFDGIPAFFIAMGEGPGSVESGFGFYKPPGIEAVPGALGLLMVFGCALLVAFFFPVRVWRDAGPSRRAYFWSFPVERGRHELLRVAGGALALELVLLVLVLLAAGTALVTDSRQALTAVPLTAWLGFFVGPLIVYLLNSIAALRSDRPAVWMAGIYYGAGMAFALGQAYTGSGAGWALRQFLEGPLSLFAAVLGPLLTEVARPHYEIDTSLWPVACGLWLVIATLGLLVAVRIRKH